MIVVDLILICIENGAKVINYCKNEKERRELARLGFSKEGKETELKAF